MRLIVGTTALRYWGIPCREPKDLDIITDTPVGEGDEILIPSQILKRFKHKDGHVSPDHLLTLKLSHMGWQTHREQFSVWSKHKRDVVGLLNLGYRVDVDLYHALVGHWKVCFGNKEFLAFDKSSEDFFDDHVLYKFSHDYLHECIKEVPTYKKCLKEGADVEIDEEKFSLLTEEEKIYFFKEEITVIAIERWLVHNRCTWYEAYILALEKTITRLTKDWMTDYILLNLKDFLQPDVELFYNFFNKHEEYKTMTIDMTIFEEFRDKYHPRERLEWVVFQMCEDDIIPWKVESKGAFLEDTEYEHLECDGGGEGGSEYCYGVFKFKGKIYKADYSYYSFQGHEYDDILDSLREVTPVQQTITVYK